MRDFGPHVLSIVIGITLFCFPTTASATPDSASDLSRAVRKMNYWLVTSSEAEGWRRYLHLNLLEAQVAKGAAADIPTLQRIAGRFHSGAAGLEHPRFVEVRKAIDAHVQQLIEIRQPDINLAVQDAIGQFQKISIEDLDTSRNRAVGEIQALIRHYRRTMPSRDRADLFFELELDSMTEALSEIEFELAPEVSIGKLQSMILDVRAQAEKIEAKLDALPLIPQANKEPELESPQPDSPQEDQNQESRQELEKKQQQLQERITKLLARRSEVLKQDRPRQIRRNEIGRNLTRFRTKWSDIGKKQGDPFYVSAANAFEEFFWLYFYGTADNLQEDYLNQLTKIESNLALIPTAESRKAIGQLGSLIRWLDYADQSPQLIHLIRRNYSQPNAYFSVSSDLINQLAGQVINETEPMRQNVSGRLVRGNIQTTGNVTFDLIDDPNQFHASIHLTGQVGISSYLQQGKLQIFTSTNGNVEGRQSILGNIGGFFSKQPDVAANFRADFLGTTSRLQLVNRIASKKFDEARAEAESGAAKQAEEQLRERFVEQTEAPVKQAQQNLGSRIKDLLKNSSKLPELYLRTTSDRLFAIVRNDSTATLAATTRPAEFPTRPQIAGRIHETLITNFLEPTFAGKTFSNAEMIKQLSELLGRDLTPDGADDANAEEEEPFSITFADVRPIEILFEDQGFAVMVSGKAFSQGNKKIRESLNIVVRLRFIQDQNGQLKLVRNGPVDFTYPGKKTPKVVGFKSFLDDRLNKQFAKQDIDIDLPSNLIPIDQIDALKESPIAQRLQLAQLRIENGWLYLGWNVAPESGGSFISEVDLIAIGSENVGSILEPTDAPVIVQPQ